MIVRKKQFYGGLGLLAAFVVVMATVFAPVFNGRNGLEYLDNLYNSISKGSAYYIPAVKEDTEKFIQTRSEFSCKMDDENQAGQTALLFMKNGAEVHVSGSVVKVSGDLGMILEGCLADSGSMYFNDGQSVAAKYGYNERQVLYNWYQALKSAGKDLQKQKKFKEAQGLALVIKKAIEPSYNFYGIESQNISARMGVVVFSLLFYVVYTLWYGFGIMYFFEGIGLQLEEEEKKEVDFEPGPLKA
jgi:hypothetical protein